MKAMLNRLLTKRFSIDEIRSGGEKKKKKKKKKRG